jgi:hypothetical protein
MSDRDFGPLRTCSTGAKRLHRGRRYDAELVRDVRSTIRQSNAVLKMLKDGEKLKSVVGGFQAR